MFVSRAFRRLKKGDKRRRRVLALKVVHALDGVENRRRDDLVQRVMSAGYGRSEVEEMVKKLHGAGLVVADVGRYSRVRVA